MFFKTCIFSIAILIGVSALNAIGQIGPPCSSRPDNQNWRDGHCWKNNSSRCDNRQECLSNYIIGKNVDNECVEDLDNRGCWKQVSPSDPGHSAYVGSGALSPGQQTLI